MQHPTSAQEAAMTFAPKPTATLRPAKNEDHIGPGVLVFGPYLAGGRSGYNVSETGAYGEVIESPNYEGWFSGLMVTGNHAGERFLLNRERVLVMSDPANDMQEV